LGGTGRRIAVQEQPQAKMGDSARHQWLMPVILATQEAEIRRIMVGSQPRQIVCENLFQKTHVIKGLVQWLKVYALSSNLSIAKNKARSYLKNS
jgi:hypothetical protein